MKDNCSLFVISKVAVFLFLSILIIPVANAAPIIDGTVRYNDPNDWGSFNVTNFHSGFDVNTDFDNVSVEEGYANGGNRYDAEEIGVFIDDNVLYIGLQAGYDLRKTKERNAIYSGDLIFNFDDTSNPDYKTFSSDNMDNDDFAFSFSIDRSGSVDMTLYGGDMSFSNPGSYYGLYSGALNKPVEVTGAEYVQEFNDVGLFTYKRSSVDYTIEAAVNLNNLTGELNTLFSEYSNVYDSVTMYWQPSCGNDFLAARTDFGYSRTNPVPEPASMFLFGIGLLAAAALGRRKINNKGVVFQKFNKPIGIFYKRLFK